MKKEILYYDGACPLCTAEVSHLKKIADSAIDFLDVHALELDQAETEKRLRVLHLETSSGDVLQGLDATVAAWQHTRWRLLFRWLRWPLIRQVTDAVYSYWADKRFDRLYPAGLITASDKKHTSNSRSNSYLVRNKCGPPNE